MPRPSDWIIDPPSPFAPREEWETHLEALLAAKAEHRTKAFDDAIADARRTLAGEPGAGADPARAARLRELVLADLKPKRRRKG